MPLFHIAGLYVAVFFSTFYDSLSLGIGTRPITADLMHQCLQHSGADAVFMPPSVVDDMALVPEYIETLKKLKFVAWGGGRSATATLNHQNTNKAQVRSPLKEVIHWSRTI